MTCPSDLKALCQQAAVHALVRARREVGEADVRATRAGESGPHGSGASAMGGRQAGPAEPAPAVLMEDFERAIADRGAGATV